MKQRVWMFMALVVGALLAGLLALGGGDVEAQVTGFGGVTEGAKYIGCEDLVASDDVTVGDDLTVTDDATLSGDTNAVRLVPTWTDVSLSSPTKTWTAASSSWFVLNSDANQTGHYPTGGSLGQVIWIRSGTGSNTMRFDDGTSLTLGANKTLTEGQGDTLGLVCVSSDGDEWALLSDGSGN